MKLANLCIRLLLSISISASLIIFCSTQASAKTINVLNYGAKGDKSTDNTTAINAAIDAASPGDTIYFPPGVYLYEHSIKPFKSLSLFAINPNTTQLYYWNPANAPVKGEYAGLLFTGKNITISNISIQHSVENNPDYTNLQQSGIYLYDVAHVTINNTIIFNTIGNQISALRTFFGDISGNQFILTAPHVMSVQMADSGRLSLANNRINGPTVVTNTELSAIASNNIDVSATRADYAAIYAISVRNFNINGNIIQGDANGGILASAKTVLGSTLALRIINNQISNCAGYGAISVNCDDGWPNVVLDGVLINQNQLTSNGTVGIRVIGLYPKTVRNVVIGSNSITTVKNGPGIWVDNTTNVTISGLSLKTTTTGTTSSSSSTIAASSASTDSATSVSAKSTTRGGTKSSGGLNISAMIVDTDAPVIYLGSSNRGAVKVLGYEMRDAGVLSTLVSPSHNAVIDLEGTPNGGTELTSVDIEKNSYIQSWSAPLTLTDYIYDGAPKHLLKSDTVSANTTSTPLPTIVTP